MPVCRPDGHRGQRISKIVHQFKTGIVIGGQIHMPGLNPVVIDADGDARTVVLVPYGFNIADKREMPLCRIERIGCGQAELQNVMVAVL